MTLLWALKQFVTRVHTLFSIYPVISQGEVMTCQMLSLVELQARNKSFGSLWWHHDMEMLYRWKWWITTVFPLQMASNIHIFKICLVFAWAICWRNRWVTGNVRRFDIIWCQCNAVNLLQTLITASPWMHPSNERRCYSVTLCLIGWALTQNDSFS